MASSSENYSQYQYLIGRLKTALNEVSAITTEIKQLNSMASNYLPAPTRDEIGTNLTKFEINYN